MKTPNRLLRHLFCAALGLLVARVEIVAQAVPPPGPKEEVITLSPFSVHGSRDVGYVATESLAGGRLSTPLKDTGVALTVLTREFLDDIAANSFLEAADWAPNANSVYSSSGPQIFNDYQVNFRSMGAGFQSRNYFRWYVNSDVYNTSRIDFARGPNSVVFGDAGVGGIANVSSKRA
jgi:outer membrane receptor protein involved in Fe transport